MNILQGKLINSIGHSVSFGCFLHLLIPGLGYIFCKEYLFGLFVFLVTTITASLVLISFIVSLSFLAKLLLFGIPLLFYSVSFIDLVKSIRKRKNQVARSGRVILLFAAVGLGFQLLIPIAPGSFFIRNRAEWFQVNDNNYAPVIRRGDLASASRLAYSADLGLQRFWSIGTILHSLPQRCDIVRFNDDVGRKRIGLVVGLPNEQIEIRDGQPIVNGAAMLSGLTVDFCAPVELSGDYPLTEGDEQSILVAELRLGSVHKIHRVERDDLIGKVGSTSEWR